MPLLNHTTNPPSKQYTFTKKTTPLFYRLLALLLISASAVQCSGQTSKYSLPPNELIQTNADSKAHNVLPGAYSLDSYLPKLKGLRVALIVNQTSEISGTLLPDTLLARGVSVVKLFSPEHGFRGGADAGAHVANGKDAKTGLEIISLYGNNKKIKAEQLKDVDVLIYDLQDVGARFYTYISTLQYALEACAEQDKQIIILDRPNPLGDVVDGPVLQKTKSSYVGLQAIPIVYGLTPGEYANMLVGEGWINARNLKLTVIPNTGYTHSSNYNLPVSPSPNLKKMGAILLYPSLCLFEGTVVSVGRGTEEPFTMFGHPDLKGYTYSFVPKSMPGATSPPLQGQRCYGRHLISNEVKERSELKAQTFQLSYLLEAYKAYKGSKPFFNSFFNNLAGNSELQEQIKAGKTEAEIRKSWEPALSKYKAIREKYLLYAE